MGFEGKNVVVTGASSGIGAAIARAMRAGGARVALVARREDRLAALAAELGPADTFAVSADLATAEGCASAAEACIAALGGRIDVLVNNAGAGKLGVGVGSMSDEHLDFHLDLNLRSVLRMTQRLLPQLRASRGAVVNMSSIAASTALRNAGAYCISKAAVEQLTKCTALELAGEGVRVNAVAPATVATEFHAAAGMGKEGAQLYYEASAAPGTHPLGRVGTPGDVARAVMFLADNEASSWITGAVLTVDGGRTLTLPTAGGLIAARD